MATSSTSFKPGHQKLPGAGRDFIPGGHPGREFRSVPMTESHLWKGDDIGYQRAHRRARKLLDMTHCSHCGATGRIQAALRSDAMVKRVEDGREFSPRSSDYIPLCIKCHRLYDDHGSKVKAAWVRKGG